MQVIDPCSGGQLDPVELEKAINAARAPGAMGGSGVWFPAPGHWPGRSWLHTWHILQFLCVRCWRFVLVIIRCERMRLGDVRTLNPEASMLSVIPCHYFSCSFLKSRYSRTVHSRSCCLSGIWCGSLGVLNESSCWVLALEGGPWSQTLGEEAVNGQWPLVYPQRLGDLRNISMIPIDSNWYLLLGMKIHKHQTGVKEGSQALPASWESARFPVTSQNHRVWLKKVLALGFTWFFGN